VDLLRDLVGDKLKKLRKAARRDDDEALHDVRTATRALRSIVRAYSDVLPKRAVRRAKKHMRRLLDATTEAREIEVALRKLDGAPAWLVHRWRRETTRALDRARRVIADEAPRVRRALKGHADGEAPEEIGRRALGQAANELAIRYEVARHVPTDRALHKVRLAAKHLRHVGNTIDVDLEPILRSVTDDVGALRDERDLEHRLRRAARHAPKRLRRVIDSLADRTEMRADDAHARLLATWSIPIDTALAAVAKMQP